MPGCAFASPKIVALVASLALFGCASSSVTPSSTGTQGSAGTGAGGTGVGLPPSGVQGTQVGLLLPLTGSAAPVGQDALRAAEMAMFDVGENSIVLLPRDTAGDSSTAARQAQALMDEGAALLLGPVFSNSVQTVAPVAARGDVNVIALSNNSRVASGNVFVLGFRPEEQVARVVSFARGTGITRFAGIGPSDSYGDVTLGALRAAVASSGGSMGPVVTYAPGEYDLTQQVQRLAGAGGAEAILVAGGGQEARTVAGLLSAQAGATPETGPRLLGTQRWLDDPALSSEQWLHGAWLAAPSPDALAAFGGRFEATYGTRPTDVVIAALAYDAVAVAARLGRFVPVDFTAAGLTTAEGFSGATGTFRLLPDGLTEHGLAVLEVAPGGTTVVDPPQRFALPGLALVN